MPRPIKIRVHYTEDTKFLIRLKSAIEKDPRPSDWKQKVIEALDQVVVMLIQAPPQLKEASRLKRPAP